MYAIILTDARNDYGESALFYAARRNMPALVRLLLQRGCDIDMTDRFNLSIDLFIVIFIIWLPVIID